MTSDRFQPIKPGAKLDPKGTALVKKMQQLSKQARAELGEHVEAREIDARPLVEGSTITDANRGTQSACFARHVRGPQ